MKRGPWRRAEQPKEEEKDIDLDMLFKLIAWLFVLLDLFTIDMTNRSSARSIWVYDLHPLGGAGGLIWSMAQDCPGRTLGAGPPLPPATPPRCELRSYRGRRFRVVEKGVRVHGVPKK